MLHIFYTHSHITSLVISSYLNHVRFANGERIIVLENRKEKFGNSISNVETIDLYDLFGNSQVVENNKNMRSIITNYSTCLKIKKFIKNTIKEPYLFYTPSYSIIWSNLLVNRKLCKGYYFLEEGILSYTSLEFLYKRYLNDRKRIIKTLLGVNRGFYLERNSKFKGTIAMYGEAFAWNENNKIVCNNKVLLDQEKYQVIVALPGSFNHHEVCSCLRKIIIDYPQESIAIKFHPTSYSCFCDEMHRVIDFIKENNINIQILPSDYNVDVAITSLPTKIISIQNVSSLMVYSILNKSIPVLYSLTQGKGVSAREICSINAVLCELYPDYNMSTKINVS